MSTLKPVINIRDHHTGNKSGAITLVEFGDFECPHCAHAHPYVKRLLEEVRELHFVFRNFPLREVHPNAYISAVAAEAAGAQDQFWEMHDLIFENRDRLNENFLLELADQLGLDPIAFKAAIAGDEVKIKIESDFESGIRSGVNGTPTFFLNGKPVYSYMGTYESLAEAIALEV